MFTLKIRNFHKILISNNSTTIRIVINLNSKYEVVNIELSYSSKFWLAQLSVSLVHIYYLNC